MDKNNYQEIILEHEWGLGNIDFMERDTVLFPESLKITDFGVDTLTFKNECILNNLIKNKNYDCEQINHDELFSEILNTYTLESHNTSYGEHFSFSFFYNDKEIKLFQIQPGNLNIRWRIEENGKTKYMLLNPYLNELLAEFLPYNSRKVLLEFKEMGLFYLLPEVSVHKE